MRKKSAPAIRQSDLDLERKLSELYKAYFKWALCPVACLQNKTLEDMCVAADCTRVDLGLLDRDRELRPFLEELREIVSRFNNLIRFNRCFAAVDRIMAGQTLVVQTRAFDFSYHNVLHEAGLEHYDLALAEFFDYTVPFGELSDLLTLHRISAFRHLLYQDSQELSKVEYIRILAQIGNNTIHLPVEEICIRHHLIIEELGQGSIYLPPKHRSMIYQGLSGFDLTLLSRNVYRAYLDARAKKPHAKLEMGDFIGRGQAHHNLGWMNVILRSDNLALAECS